MRLARQPEDIKISMERGILRIRGESKGELDGWTYQNAIEKSVQVTTLNSACTQPTLIDHTP